MVVNSDMGAVGVQTWVLSKCSTRPYLLNHLSSPICLLFFQTLFLELDTQGKQSVLLRIQVSFCFSRSQVNVMSLLEVGIQLSRQVLERRCSEHLSRWRLRLLVKDVGG